MHWEIIYAPKHWSLLQQPQDTVQAVPLSCKQHNLSNSNTNEKHVQKSTSSFLNYIQTKNQNYN